MSYEEFETKAFRRAILRFLLAQPDGQLSETLLVMQLEADAFYREQTKRRADISFLSDRGLISARFIGPIMLLQLLDRGRIVALGKERVEGIADNALPTG